MRFLFLLTPTLHAMKTSRLEQLANTLPKAGTVFGQGAPLQAASSSVNTADNYFVFGYSSSQSKDEFYALPCHTKPGNDLEDAFCNILDPAKKCGGVDPTTQTLLSPEKMCDPDCQQHISQLFEAQGNADVVGSVSAGFSLIQAEILSSLVNTVSRAYCENCRTFCWQINCSYW
jgi:hypothetical protein